MQKSKDPSKACFEILRYKNFYPVIHCSTFIILCLGSIGMDHVISFGLLIYVPGNSYGHVRTVSSPNHTFSWASLNKRLTSLGPGWDQTRDPWICSQIRICSQTNYRLSYAARYVISELCYKGTILQRNYRHLPVIPFHGYLPVIPL